MIPNKEIKWILAFNLLNTIDIIQTLFVTLKLGGTELNPFMRFFLEAGPMYFVSFKFGVGVLATLYSIKKPAYRVLKLGSFLLGAVVLWNMCVLVIRSM